MTPPRPLITVVIPALNAEAWIGETLASVAAQTYPHDRLEIVLVDDGSTDATAERARAELKAGDIAHVVLRNPSSLGPSAARNRGWRSGRGNWIQFLDSDDLLEPSKIELQATAAVAVSNDVAALYSNWGRLTMVDQPSRQVATWFEPRIGEDQLLDVLRAESFLQVGCLLFSREWLEKTGGFDESCRLIEDVDLLMRLVMANGRLHRVPTDRPVSWYRQREGSLSRESDQAFIDGCLRNARFAERFWTNQDALTPTRADLIAAIYFMGARFYAARDHRAASASLLADIDRLVPNFLPPGSQTLRWLSRVLGYRRAETIAAHHRRWRRAFRSVGAPAQ
ncbi:MAG: glycosyltransferase family 2 protein [Vicinamibacterales bacterium]